MNVLRYFNPRRQLTAAIGWPVFAIILVASFVGANLAAKGAAERALADTQRLMAQFATQVRYAIDAGLKDYQSTLEATAAQIVVDDDQGQDPRRYQRHLEAVRQQFPDFVWIGVADETGSVIASTHVAARSENAAPQKINAALQTVNVAGRIWFQLGRKGRFLADTRLVSLFDEHMSLSALNTRSPGFLMAAPLRRPLGAWGGVIVARLAWKWLEDLQPDLLRGLELKRTLDMVVAAADKTVLLGPPQFIGRTLGADTDLTEGGRYVIAENLMRNEPQGSLGWTVVMRQDTELALTRARMAHHTVFQVVLIAGLIAALVVVYITHNLTRRVAALDAQAQAVRQGQRENLSVPDGTDEISRIGTTLKDLVGYLQQEKHALATLNTELDARVSERTARIERMAEEARYAAVTRERMRLARELHDTLAHSLMALLTQVRLIRKLHRRLDPADLDAELGRAEEVAATGLTEARAAITQMRHNSVRDEGLGAALQQLLRRFRERSGVETVWKADLEAAGLADERAETVFRIVEEALNNVERHAHAKTVQVILQWIESPDLQMMHWNLDEPVRMRVEIADDGVGFDPTVPCPGHYGLRGIHEQAELIHATLELQSQPQAGTRLILEFIV